LNRDGRCIASSITRLLNYFTKKNTMKLFKRIKIRAGFAIFFIFLALGILEFIRTQQMTGILFFGTLALAFLALESANKRKPVQKTGY
jgi:hypothetical protein